MGMRGWDGFYDGRYIFSRGRDNVLYDHEQDPHELENLFPSDPATMRKMNQQLHTVMQKSGHPEVERFAT